MACGQNQPSPCGGGFFFAQNRASVGYVREASLRFANFLQATRSNPKALRRARTLEVSRAHPSQTKGASREGPPRRVAMDRNCDSLIPRNLWRNHPAPPLLRRARQE